MFGLRTTVGGTAFSTGGRRHLLLDSFVESRAVRLLALLLVTTLAMLTLPILQADRASAAEGDSSYLVTFASGTSAEARAAAIAGAGATDVSSIPQLRIHTVSVPAAEEADVVAALRGDASVSRVDADKVRAVEGAPDDTSYGDQWALPKIGWDTARDSVSPAGSAVVAVLDTGVDASHPDLAGNLVAGTSVLDGSAGTTDPNGHGTAMAGIVAAETNNGSGIAGVGYAGVKVMPVTVLGADGTGQDSDIINGVVHAADNGADVILMAFSNPGYSGALQAAVDYAWSKGAVLVAAAGNDGSSTPAFPAGDRGVVGVSNTTQDDSLNSSSNTGDSVFLGAPGTGIRTLGNGGGVTTITGTSASAAVVAGSAAVLAANSPASNGVIVGRLARNADAAGTAAQTGNGRVNLDRALADESTEAVKPAGAAPVAEGGPYVGPYTIAAATVSSATLNGGSTVSVTTGASISAAVTITSPGNGANNRAGFVGWRIASTIGGLTCVDIPDVSNTTTTVSFNITAPATAGTYNAYFQAFSDSTCTNNPSNLLPLSNGVTTTVPNNPVPTTTGITPSNKVQNSSGFTLTVMGTNFVSGSVVRFNGNDRPTTFVSATQVTAAIAASDLTTTGNASITVVNPTPGGGTSNAQNFTVYSCASVLVCIDGNMADWAGLAATPSYADNTADAGGGSGDITAIRLTAGNGNLYVRWDVTLPSNRNMIAQDGFSISVDADRNGVADSRGWVMFNSSGVATVQVERPFGTFTTTGAAEQSCNFSACSNGASVSIESAFPLSAFNATGAIVGVQTETRASPSTSSSVKDCVPGGVACNGYFHLDTETGTVVVTTGHVTTTTLDCPDASVTVNDTTSTCTVTVRDTGRDTNNVVVPPAKPTGTVNFVESGGSGTFTPVACTLSPLAGTSDRSTCTLTYTPTTIGTHTLTASYAGDTLPVQFAGSSNNDTLGVVSANDAPVAVNDAVNATEDMAAVFNVISNDTDVDGDPLSVKTNSLPASSTQGGSLELITVGADTGNIRYTPAANFHGADSFTYKATDGSAESNTATVTITVASVNDAPSFTKGGDQTVAEDAGAQSVSGWATAISRGPADESGQLLSFTTSNDNNALFSVQPGVTPNGTLVYTSAPNAHGSATVTIRLSDSGGTANGGVDTSAAQTFTITVNAVNDAPVAVDDGATTDEDTAVAVNVLGNDSDVEGSTLSVVASSISSPAYGTATVVTAPGPDQGTIRYTPNANFVGTDSFTYRASDGTATSNVATVTITVDPVNDAPVAVDDITSTNEDSAKVIDVKANDTDVDSTSLNVVAASISAPAHGTAVLITSGDDAGKILYTPAADYNGGDSFTYTVSDGTHASNAATVSITVNAVNDAPVAVNDGASTDEDTAVAVNVLGNDSDVEGSTLSVVASSISSPANGTATVVTAPGPDQGTIRYTPNADFVGTDSFTYRASDGTATSNVATVSITVNAVNDAPVAVNDSELTDEDTAVAVDVRSNDTDVDSSSLSVVAASISAPAHGTAVLITSGDDAGKILYTPSLNYNGGDSFTYTVSDGTHASNAATVSITVNAVNDAPVAVNDGASTDEDTAVAVNVLGNDSDVEGSTLSVVASSISSSANGTAMLVTAPGPDQGTIRYTPNANFNGTDSFTYKVSDGELQSNVATVSITVNAVNDAPVAVNDSELTDEDTAVAVDVRSNDTDVDSSSLSVVAASISAPAHGTAVLITSGDDAGKILYTPSLNYNGGDSFTYRVSDGALESNAATVNITVNAVNDAPVAVADSKTVAEDAAATELNVLGNDTDVDTAASGLSVSGVTQPTNGTVTLVSGVVRYAPAANFNGGDSFTYTVTDGALSDTATVSVTVTEVNDAPTAANDSKSTNEDVALQFAATDLVGNDSKGPGNESAQTLTVTAVSNPVNGTVTLANGQITFTPTGDYNGPASFTYTVTDNGTTNRTADPKTDTATVNVTVNAVNDAPVAVNDSESTDEDTAVAVDVRSNDTDVDSSSLSVVAASISAPAHGTAVLITSGDDAGKILYTPATNYNGPDSFTYRVSDGSLGSNTATVNITVNAVNDAPVAVSDSATTDEDTLTRVNVLGNDSDVENSTLSVVEASISSPANGTATLITDGTDAGKIQYTPNANFNGADTFTYKATDGSLESNTATVSITVASVNDAPSFTKGADHTVAEDAGAQSVSGWASAISAGPANESGQTVSFVVTNNSNTALFSVAPSVSSSGTLTYTPAANANGSATISVKITDNGGTANGGVNQSSVETFTITVEAVNDAPSFTKGVNQTVAEDAGAQSVSGWASAISAGPANESGQTVSFVVTNNSNTALFSVAPSVSSSGTLTYTPAANANGSATISVKITDNGGTANGGVEESSVQTFTITVTSVNDTPVVSPATATRIAQYSDSITPVLVTAQDDADNGTAALTASTQWKLSTASTFTTGLPMGLSLTEATAISAGRVWELAGRAMVAPGTYVIRVNILDSSGATGTSEVTVTVEQEDARATYTGATFASTGSATSSKATITLSATVQDITAVLADPKFDAEAGDIRNAKVTFYTLNGTTQTDIASCSNLSVGLVSTGELKTGAATCNWAVDIGNNDSFAYTVGIRVLGYYVGDAVPDPQVITVSKAISGMLTGGGYIINQASSGLVPGQSGLRTNFGFNAKVTKTGALQGNVNIIVRNSGRVYQIKSNAITSLNTLPGKCSTTTPCPGTFNGKANIQDITNPTSPISIDGNASLQINVNDKGEPGTNDDIAATLWDKNGGVWFSSKWDGTKTVAQVLNGGNIQVR